MKISYNWIKSYLPDIPEPHRLADLFTYHVCEVESVEKLSDGDFLFDLGILPNRAHDLLSHQGVARELSGLLAIAYKDPTGMYKTPATVPTNLSIEINSDTCRRYSARIIRNVTVGLSPEWMVKHLESIGQRSINNVVDATNIVMYDSGQPTHAFDLKKLAGDKIIITNAQEGEELPVVGRDHVVAKLKDTDMVITDGQKSLAIAGVKGGRDSGITSDTTDIVLEVANFDPVSVRKTARRLNLLSDSAKRFENDLSPELCTKAMFELSALLIELFPEATFEDIVDVYPKKQESHSISFTTDFINKKLGSTITDKEVETILKNYGYEFTKSENTFTISVPALRLDLAIPEDMVEEIGRVYGYDKVTPILPKLDFTPKKNETYEKISQARASLLAEGYREVMTYAFANTGGIEVLASASDKNFLRTNLSDGLKKSYEMNRLNAPLLALNEIKIFEIGTVFKDDTEVIHVGYADKKGVTEEELEVFFEKIVSSEGASELDEARLRNFSAEKYPYPSEESYLEEKNFESWSLYPFITRDIAVWVPEGITPESLSEIYEEFGAEILRGKPTLFDQFTKNGRTSYAFRLVFQAYDKTLTDEEVNVIMGHINEKIAALGYEAR